jgi:hypothetical protein
MEPASLHAGRVYHPAAGGGNMHIRIESRLPVTVAMVWADEWTNAVQHPEAPANFSFLCLKEHVVSTIYECRLPSERPMILTIRDERQPERPIVTTIGAILGPSVRQFISPQRSSHPVLRLDVYQQLHPARVPLAPQRKRKIRCDAGAQDLQPVRSRSRCPGTQREN